MNIFIEKHPFYAKLAYVLVSLIALVYIAIVGKTLLSPLVFSFLFAILLYPSAKFLEQRLRFPRGLSSFVSILLFLVVISLVFWLLGAQFVALSSDWPMFKEQIISSVQSLQDWIVDTFHVDKDNQANYLTDAAKSLLSSSTTVIGTTVMSISSIMLFLVFTFIYTFFILFYRRLIINFLSSVFHEKHTPIVHEVLGQIQYIIRRYVIGIFLQIVIISIVTCLTFWILGVKYPILLGVLTGIINIIPYVGIFTAMFITSLITFATAGTFVKVAVVIGALSLIHLMDSNILLPIVVGSQVKINAFITVLAIFSGEMIWGVAGMFLSIPIIAVLKIIFDRVPTLHPWGYLIGDDKPVSAPTATFKKVKPRK